MGNWEDILAKLILEYNISDSSLKKLKSAFENAEPEDLVNFMSETMKPNTGKRKRDLNINTDEIYLPPSEYIRTKYNAIVIGVAEKGQQHRIHYHRIIISKRPLNYRDIINRYKNRYTIWFSFIGEVGKTDPDRIKKVLEYMYKQRKKNNDVKTENWKK
ncbi:hypothetical protein ARV1_gp08 [Acidianus rod-shaped virus 1]|uniref:Uncharacterized protein n=1 Tax=Acidianus rod-shaped virus 1 TaxID=309181 RepID=Q50I63_9VIRU|nr:hypothetical protein ARV1_gp08 [Acidianus rod-shaped virus 1]CAI44163.1 hypothetical protein [Acidianus rod-shaped virus 1]